MTDPSRPSFGAALRSACRAYRSRFGEVLLFLLYELTVRLIALAPLIALFFPGQRWIALMSLPLFVLLVLPARRRAALAYASLLHGGHLFVRELGVGWRSWGRLLWDGVKTTLCALCWASPLIAAAVWAVSLYAAEGVQGSTDGLTVIRQVKDLGGGNPFMGALLLGLFVLALILLAAVGCGFHAGARHDEVRPPRVIRGFTHRGRVFGAWLLGTLCFLPFAAVIGLVAWDILSPVFGGLLSALRSFGSSADATEQQLEAAVKEAEATVQTADIHGWRGWAAAGSFALLLLPAIPLKGLFCAAAVDSLKEDV